MRLAFQLSSQASTASAAAGPLAVRAAAADPPQAHHETSHSPQTRLLARTPRRAVYQLKFEPAPVTTHIVAKGELSAEVMGT